MPKNLDGSPPPPLWRPRYGVDAPAVPLVNGAVGVMCCLAAARKYAAHLVQGELRGLGPGYWYGAPLLAVTLLHVVKER